MTWAPFSDITASLTTIARICAALCVVAGVIVYASRQSDFSGILMIIGRIVVAVMALGFVVGAIRVLTAGWANAAN